MELSRCGSSWNPLRVKCIGIGTAFMMAIADILAASHLRVIATSLDAQQPHYFRIARI